MTPFRPFKSGRTPSIVVQRHPVDTAEARQCLSALHIDKDLLPWATSLYVALEGKKTIAAVATAAPDLRSLLEIAQTSEQQPSTAFTSIISHIISDAREQHRNLCVAADPSLFTPAIIANLTARGFFRSGTKAGHPLYVLLSQPG